MQLSSPRFRTLVSFLETSGGNTMPKSCVAVGGTNAHGVQGVLYKNTHVASSANYSER